MESIVKKLKFNGDGKFKLKDHKPDESLGYNAEDAETVLQDLKKQISELQVKLYAENKFALLIVFQAMDAAGKDSAIAHTMAGINPQGCQVYSFKQPSSLELSHDFLWRHYLALPQKGRIGIHNRSHYENVLVCKVHPEIVVKQQIAGINDVKHIDDNFWDSRYKSIRNFEKHLAENGTVMIKFFLNVSKDEQKRRFLKRIDDPNKNWKFSSADIGERQHWDEYMAAYEKAINETATPDNPWYIIPADKKWVTSIAILTVVLKTMQDLKLQFPVLSADEQAKLKETERILLAE